MKIQSQAIAIAKILLGINNAFEDDLLLTLGNIVEKEALTYTKNEAILYENELLGQMIVAKYRLRGNEGLSSQTLATVSESYITTYPETVNIALRGFRKIVAL